MTFNLNKKKISGICWSRASLYMYTITQHHCNIVVYSSRWAHSTAKFFLHLKCTCKHNVTRSPPFFYMDQFFKWPYLFQCIQKIMFYHPPHENLGNTKFRGPFWSFTHRLSQITKSFFTDVIGKGVRGDVLLHSIYWSCFYLLIRIVLCVSVK